MADEEQTTKSKTVTVKIDGKTHKVAEGGPAHKRILRTKREAAEAASS